MKIIIALIVMAFLASCPLRNSNSIIQEVDERPANLENFMIKHKCSEPYYINDYITEADKNGINYKILPVISVLESSCGRRYPLATNNRFGYGSSSGLYRFKSEPEAITFISNKLGFGRHYAGKSLEKKIRTYNSENPVYWSNFLKLYNEIP